MASGQFTTQQNRSIWFLVIFLAGILLLPRLESRMIGDFSPYAEQVKLIWSSAVLVGLEFSYWLCWVALVTLVLHSLYNLSQNP